MHQKNRLSIKTYIFITMLLFSGTAIFLHSKLRNNWGYAIKSTLAFAKKQIQSKPINIKNYPSTTQQFLTHLNAIYNFNNKTNSHFTENIAGLKWSFPDYITLHVLFNEIFIHKEYFFQTDKKDPFIIDCGSNIGMATLFFKTLYPNAKILAFEPSKPNFDLLELNIKNNNLKNIKLIKKALSNKIENIKLYNPGNIISSTKNKVANEFEIVKTTLLSDYIDQKVDFLKMDIEGAETFVFEDLKNKDKLKYINEMIIEYHHTLKENGLSKLLKALEDNNFVYQISSNLKTPFEKNNYQVFLIHAYQK